MDAELILVTVVVSICGKEGERRHPVGSHGKSLLRLSLSTILRHLNKLSSPKVGTLVHKLSHPISNSHFLAQGESCPVSCQQFVLMPL